jgi:methyl-accepting chemotaxis protein
MAFGLFRRREPEAASPVPVSVPKPQERAAVAESSGAESDSAHGILELVEPELGGKRAAASVASGAEATAATLSNIRSRTDALAARTNSALMMREIDVPIRVRDWGGFRTAYKL